MCLKDTEIDILIRKNETLKDEIAKLKAEIERLKAECGNQSTLWSQHYQSIFETTKEIIKSEAYKEFSNRFEKKLKDVQFTIGQTWDIKCCLNETLSELTEQKESESNA